MNHWIALPVILPSLLAPLIVAAMRHDLSLQRIFGAAGTLALLGLAIGLFVASGDGPQVYDMGNWPAPFGIVLVLDRLSALMLLLTAVLSCAIFIYVVATDWDLKGRHFHALFQFQLMGINGAFLTGDLFNLFVFFEVLLIASYGLMLHGGGAARLRAGLQYVAINLAGATLFLFALGTLYGLTGTLNMAELAVRVPLLPEGDAALLRVGAVLLLMVFAVKAALVPLHFWLPIAYGAAPAPVAALFAIMTKVGAYAILRCYILIFGEGSGAAEGLAGAWLMPAALVTVAVGMIGVLGARRLTPLVTFSVVGSMGTLLVAVAMFTEAATSVALYYLLHSTFAAAALFLTAELTATQRGAQSDALRPSTPMAGNELLAGLFFAAAIAMVGMPPLSGFLGKLMVLDVVRGHALVWTIWAVVLVTSLIAVVGFARAGSSLYWKSAQLGGGPAEDAPGPAPAAVAAAALLIAGPVALTVFAGPAMAWLEAAAAELHAPGIYIEAVMGAGAEAAAADRLAAR